jgi:hypothetical protein
MLNMTSNQEKDNVWRTFCSLRQKRAPQLELDQNITFSEAIQKAYIKGIQEGYGEGLVDGVRLGSDRLTHPSSGAQLND